MVFKGAESMSCTRTGEKGRMMVMSLGRSMERQK